MKKYKNHKLPVEERVEDLLSRMTLKEKIGQLNQRMLGWHAYKKNGSVIELTQSFKDEISFGDGVGALYGLHRADPWSAVTYNNGIPLESCARTANMIQQYVIENTRLGIPVLLSEECPHGHQALDGTMLPTNTGIGSTWNPELYQQVFSHVAAEIRSRGGHLGLVSALDILHDPRWGRSEECYGEDPYLASRMTEAVVKGLQGMSVEELKRPDKVAAVLKHFCAQGAAMGGHNGKSAPIGERELREIHLPGMKAGMRAGAAACMAAYNEIDGVLCHGNKRLLTEILRDEWGFEGTVMSDGCAVDGLVGVAGDLESAAALAISAGVDLNLWNEAYTKVEDAVLSGKLDEAAIDRAVSRVLELKFRLGLFENPFTDEKAAGIYVNSMAMQKANLQLARESIVLIKNDDNILPLRSDIKRLAVIGPNADNLYNQLGDYTAPQREGTGVTVLEGIQSCVSLATEVVYARGCGIRDDSREGFAQAVEAAEKSDVAVLVLGGSSARNFDMNFAENGAAILSGNPSDMDCGEGVDVADVALSSIQQELVREIAATGTSLVVILIQGRPYALSGIIKESNAILCAWYPGKEGGRAVADILFGNENPSGKLPVSIPRSSAQLPVYYNYKETSDYLDMTSQPLYSFGHGMSYTTFVYDNLRLLEDTITVNDLNRGKAANVSVQVKNTGPVAGAEVVQLYIKDLEASITRRNRELKGFQKVWLNPGEEKTVILSLGQEELSVWDINMQFVVEPGNVRIMVGGDSVNTMHTTLRIVS